MSALVQPRLLRNAVVNGNAIIDVAIANQIACDGPFERMACRLKIFFQCKKHNIVLFPL